jgi:uncharacterized protein YdaL
LNTTSVGTRGAALLALAITAACGTQSESAGPTGHGYRHQPSPAWAAATMNALPSSAPGEPAPTPPPSPALLAIASGSGVAVGAETLVLYDVTGPYGWLGELYAIGAVSLASHFGSWTAKPVASYASGDIARFTATIYVGSTYDEPIPTAFLDDVLSGSGRVVWIYDNVWQLANRAAGFSSSYGFEPDVFDTSAVGEVDYKGTALSRYTANGDGIMTYSVVDASRAVTLATAVRADGTTFPWALRAGNLTYIGENPMSFVTLDDRYLAFADLLFDELAPGTAQRHRALVRIEDIHAMRDPAELRAIADYLSSQNVPFGMSVIPLYKDPLGYYNGGVPETVGLSDAPDVVAALDYMVQKGGTILSEGYTHQYDAVANPYTGVTADDAEFYRAHVDANNTVVWDGPVAEDSTAWADARVTGSLEELAKARISPPGIWMFPHYMGSAIDAVEARKVFEVAYHRGIYFSGGLAGGAGGATGPTGAAADPSHTISVLYPYSATDIYGFQMIPENLGDYEPVPFNNNPARLPSDIVHTAHLNRVVRDGFASFFFDPDYDVSILKQIVDGVRAEGYVFVRPLTVTESP